MKRESWKIKDCMICGKKFVVKVDLVSHKILNPCFHGHINNHFFIGWAYEVLDCKTLTTKIVFKNLFWKIVGYTWLQRKIVYGLWWLFYGWKTWEYWECETCACREDDV